MSKTKDGVNIRRGSTECCSARDVLWYVVFWGFAINYMIRINLNIAIVSMVQQRPRDNVTLTSECIPADQGTREYLETNKNHEYDEFPKNLSFSSFNLSETILDFGSINNSMESNKFDWDEIVQGNVLGSFFWVHWVTQIPGGILASKYGTKLVFGLSNFIGVLFNFVMPYFAHCGYEYLMALRFVQGLLCGFAWPSMHHMVGKWIPPNERSKFVTAYLGSSVGTALTYPMCGFIIDKWGWEYAFYACGIIGTLWFIAWQVLVYDTPKIHPRISNKERNYIDSMVGDSVSNEKMEVPWTKLLKCKDVWMNVMAQSGTLWGFFILMTHAPTYFKFIHGWDIKATGLLSGMPHMFRMLWAYVFSVFGDYLLRSDKMSRTNVRKLATGVCCIGQGFFMLGLAYSGCDSITAILCLTLAVAVQGSMSTGSLASIVDISPNYSCIILGFANTGAAIVGFITPAVIGSLTHQNQTSHQWQIVFWISTIILFATGIIYSIFSESNIKSWNNPKRTSQSNLPENEAILSKKLEDIEKGGGLL